MGKFLTGVLVGGTIAYLGHRTWCRAADNITYNTNKSTRSVQDRVDDLVKASNQK
jgi:hypothetical protein